jgi:hypothetical protein
MFYRIFLEFTRRTVKIPGKTFFARNRKMLDLNTIFQVDAVVSNGGHNFYTYVPVSEAISRMLPPLISQVEVGEFLVSIWTTDCVEYGIKGDHSFSVTIYRNGSRINGQHPSVMCFSWSRKLELAWRSENYSVLEVVQIIGDLGKTQWIKR